MRVARPSLLVLALAASGLVAVALPQAAQADSDCVGAGTGTVTCTYVVESNVGGTRSFTVPEGVTSVTISAVGGRGGDARFTAGGGTGGRAAAVSDNVVTTAPGDVLNITVAGNGGTWAGGATTLAAQGGFGGGGNTGTKVGSVGPYRGAGAGGGASRVTRDGAPLVIAGGGGGAGAWVNGAVNGGSAPAGDGDSPVLSMGGKAAIGILTGTGGTPSSGPNGGFQSSGGTGSSGSLYSGGGGGGGYAGGGGGGAPDGNNLNPGSGGGGAGSSLGDNVTTSSARPSVTIVYAEAPGAAAADDQLDVTEDAAQNPVAVNLFVNDSVLVDGSGSLSLVGPGTFTLDHGTLVTDEDGSATYTLDNANEFVDALNNGETLTDTYTYTVRSASGGPAQATLTITIHGATDPGTVTAVDDSGEIVEDTTFPYVAGNLLDNDTTTHGNLAVTAEVGTLQHGDLYVQDSGGYLYVLDTSDPAVDALNDDETLTDTYTYTAKNGLGATGSATLSITIKGRTDVVVNPITAVDDSGEAIENDPFPFVIGNVLTNDTTSTGGTLVVANPTYTALAYGTLNLSENGEYFYVLDNLVPAVHALNDGETLTDTFTYTVADGSGATSSATLTITIKGVSDDDAITAVDDTGQVTEDDALPTAGGNVLANDTTTVGTLEVTNSINADLSYGDLLLQPDGEYVYFLETDDPAVDALDDGETLTETYTYQVANGLGATGAATLTITIKGHTDVVDRNFSVSGSQVYGGTPTFTAVDDEGTSYQTDGMYCYVMPDGAAPLIEPGLEPGDYSLYHCAGTVVGLDPHVTPVFQNGGQFRVTTGPNGVTAADQLHVIREDLPHVAGSFLDGASTTYGELRTTFEAGELGERALTYGSINLFPDGAYLYSLDTSNPAVRALNAGETVTETFPFTLSNGVPAPYGSTATAALKVTIKGTTDVVVTVTASKTYGDTQPTYSYTTVPTGATVEQVTCITSSGGTPSNAYQSAGTYQMFGCSGTVDLPDSRASFSGGSLVVAPAPLTITASNGSQAFGSATPPVITPQVDGLVNGDTVASLGTITCTADVTATTPAGPHPGASSCTGAANPNYAITYVAGDVEVTPLLDVTVTASNGTQVYGATTPPVITPTVSGLPEGVEESVLGTITCSAAVGPTTGVGPHEDAATCAVTGESIYNVTTVAGDVEVTPALVTIKAGDTTSVWKTNPPAPSVTLTGFKNGQTRTVLTTQPTCTAGVSAATNPGIYPGVNSCSGAAAANYTFAYVNGNATVTKASVVITTSKTTIKKSILTGKMTFSAKITHKTTGAPLAGVPVTFLARTVFGGRIGCTATTNSNGVATCSNANRAFVLIYPPSGFTATVATGTQWAGTTKRGVITYR